MSRYCTSLQIKFHFSGELISSHFIAEYQEWTFSNNNICLATILYLVASGVEPYAIYLCTQLGELQTLQLENLLDKRVVKHGSVFRVWRQ